MTPKERMLAALSLEELDRPPVGCFTQSATVDQMEAVKAAWPEAHSDPNLMATLGAAGAKVLGFENVRIPFDLTVEAEVFGCKVNMGKIDRTPMVNQHVYEEESDPKIPENFLKTGRVKVVIEATKIAKEKYGHELPIVVGVTGPLTLAGHLVSTEHLLLWMITDPDAVHKFIKVTAEAEREYTNALVKAGADIIVANDPSASTDMLAPPQFDEFAAKYIKIAFSEIGNAKSVLHICGNTTALLDNMINTGVNGLSIEEKVDPREAVMLVSRRAALVGNIGVVNPLLQGTPETVRAATIAVKEAGFNVVAPGCGVAARVSKANLEAMVKAVKG